MKTILKTTIVFAVGALTLIALVKVNEQKTNELQVPVLAPNTKVNILAARGTKEVYVCAVYTDEQGKRGLLTPALKLKFLRDSSVAYAESYNAWSQCQRSLKASGIRTKRADLRRSPGLWDKSFPKSKAPRSRASA